MKKYLFHLVLATTIFTACTKKQATDDNAKIEAKVDSLLKLMTLDEKIGQMNQLSSTGNLNDFKELIKKGGIGSFLNEVNPATINAMQRIALEESRLKIPLIFQISQWERQMWMTMEKWSSP